MTTNIAEFLTMCETFYSRGKGYKSSFEDTRSELNLPTAFQNKDPLILWSIIDGLIYAIKHFLQEYENIEEELNLRIESCFAELENIATTKQYNNEKKIVVNTLKNQIKYSRTVSSILERMNSFFGNEISWKNHFSKEFLEMLDSYINEPSAENKKKLIAKLKEESSQIFTSDTERTAEIHQTIEKLYECKVHLSDLRKELIPISKICIY